MHLYPGQGNFTARIDSCCRISPLLPPNAHINNPDGTYRVETLVNVGTANSSPVSSLPPIVNCPQNSVCSFIVPGADSNGDRLRFRLSLPAEASNGVFRPFVQPGPPHAPSAATISPSGVYTWNTTGATLGPPGFNTLYSTQVTVEDLDASGNAKSKIAVDFFIQLVPKVGDPPVFNSPPTAPACGAPLSVKVGEKLSFTIQASDPDPGQTVTLNVANLPAGATMTPALPTTGNPVSSTFTWTPTANDAGTHVITFTATDNSAGQAGQQSLCSITVVAVPTGRMTGGGSVLASDGSRVTHGFEFHCNTAELPNNLEVNWGSGNNFHLENLVLASCSDDPAITPNPPIAGFDTYSGFGTGRYNGVSGATVEWTFTDAGEPGTKDTARLVIRDTGGNVVLSVAGNLDRGNHQTHK